MIIPKKRFDELRDVWNSRQDRLSTGGMACLLHGFEERLRFFEKTMLLNEALRKALTNGPE